MNSTKKQGSYPIRAVSRLTRLSLDTLRAWERRYRAVSPARRNGIRLYTAADIERLSLLREALDRGHSIGHAAKLSDADLKSLVAAAPANEPVIWKKKSEPQHPAQLDAVIAAIEGFSYAAADRELSRLSWLMTPRDVVHGVALPLMRLAGQRFHDQRLRVSQEHMLTQLLGNLLSSMMRTNTPENPAATILMSTLSDDLHAFGTLAAGMLAASAGLGVIHLGPNLPPEEISYAAKRSSADVVLVSVTGSDRVAPGREQIRTLSRKLSRDIELWLGVNPPEIASQLIPPKSSVRVITDFAALEQQLRRVGGRF
jgi:DNA-binding transcriptional MerR regulator/methylmalonyl-CoA mutase cobalamin-binding subunit